MKLKFFNIARELSFLSDSKFKLGCIITSKNRIISDGYNSMTKSHTKCATYGNFRHAELHALIGTDYPDTKNSVAYIYRETKDGKPANSRPCEVCYKALKKAGVKKICFTTNGGYFSENI